MDNNMKQMMKEMNQTDGGHILYCFDELQAYIQNEAMFIISGVKQGSHILVLENDRIFPFVYKTLQLHLNEVQLESVHHINNFDFYCFEGDFYPSTMADYFLRNIEVYLDSDVPLQTWGHVEWGESDHIVLKNICDYESNVNQIFAKRCLVSVCAYDEYRLSATLKSTLMKHHGMFMTDETCTIIAN